ncbi:MAG: hypothetical protein ACXIT4_13335 [Erythrobacter sp.]
MSDSGFASLGPTLLARKGGAKPAMRPQLPVLTDPAEVAKLADEQLEDLGWNDMGDDGNHHADDDHAANGAANVVPIDRETRFDAEAVSASPIIRRQQRRLEERVLADAVMNGPEDGAEDYGAAGFDHEEYGVGYDPTDVAESFAPLPAPPHHARPAPARSAEPASAKTRRAAFTLRLDQQRHLKLRLAATMRGVSAQALVTEALDAMLDEIDELDGIAARMQRH